MTRPFLETQAPIAIDFGSSFGQSYAVMNTSTSSGDSYGILQNPFPILRYDLGYTNREQSYTTEQVINLYHTVGGTFGGFRLKDWADYSTNNYVDVPTGGDQICIATAIAGQYQMVRWYGTQGDMTQPRRLIKKPVDGSGLVAVDSVITTEYVIDYATGLILFNPGFEPLPTEVVTCGCYFDIPVRFESDLSGANLNTWDTISLSLNVVELLNP